MPTAELDLRCLAANPEATATVRDLLTSVQAVLGDTLVAVWFDGSIALGDFDPSRSDIDLVVVTGAAPPSEWTADLRAAHVGCAVTSPSWGGEIETIYATPAALRSAAVSSGISHLYVERGSGGELCSGPLDPGWLVHLRVLREHGVSITGPAPVDLVEAVSDEELKDMARWGAERWLSRYRDNPAALDHLGARVFSVLTICRLLCTLRTGRVVSKMTAARWTLAAVPPSLAPVIEGAMAWRKDDAASERTTVQGALALIDWTQAACKAWAP